MSEEQPEARGDVRSMKPKMTTFLCKKKVMLGLAIPGVVVGLCALAVVYFYTSAKHSNTISDACTTEATLPILKEAGTSLDPSGYIMLGETISKIKKIPKFERDPNCLYPIVIYYINTSDYINSRLYLSKMEKVYNTNNRLNPALGDTKTLKSLESTVDYLKKDLERLSNNSDKERGNHQP